MSILTDIYNTGFGDSHEAGLVAVWNAAIASAIAPVVLATPTMQVVPELTEIPEVTTPTADVVTNPKGELS